MDPFFLNPSFTPLKLTVPFTFITMFFSLFEKPLSFFWFTEGEGDV
jgi:hypothetical protein